MSNQQKIEKEIEHAVKVQQTDKDAAIIELLEHSMQQAEGARKAIDDLIGSMDKVCIELKAAGNPSWDFLMKDKRPANNGS
ncbi:MAG: hypothetical protein DI551_08350 [Micavibrio aeruginosavorus]|uniref:Uncharacterized protein n=1 Tax=Micavibrio aeruginosavorus TaxID=349221 RepID=A0A2W5N2T1_9BACT|nr:MAG: hypothetical protein DI551_08350 [Micavibrio aeruginosavorus]